MVIKSTTFRLLKTNKEAAKEGSDVIAFHECLHYGLYLARKLTKEQMLELQKNSQGESIHRLQQIAAENNIVILAYLLKKDEHDNIHKAYIYVDKTAS